MRSSESNSAFEFPLSRFAPARKSAHIISRQYPRDLSVPSMSAAVSSAFSTTAGWLLLRLKVGPHWQCETSFHPLILTLNQDPYSQYTTCRNYPSVELPNEIGFSDTECTETSSACGAGMYSPGRARCSLSSWLIALYNLFSIAVS